MEVAVFDTKSYDRHYLSRQSEGTPLVWRFFESRLLESTAALATGCQAVCIFVNDRCDDRVLEVLESVGVRLVALRCAGFNNVDLASAQRRKIHVVRVPAYSPHAVAEHTVGLLLAVNRKLHRAYNRVREQNFSLQGLVGFDIAGKTVGVIGTGKIGKITAQILSSFEARVLAFDEFPDREWADLRKIPYTSFESLLRESDILSLHVPLTPQTHHLLNTNTLSITKPGVTILNTGRGKLIDTRSLIHFLKTGHIGAVALDVYEEEEGVFFEDLSGQVLQDDELSRLLTFPNVLMTSHQAFLTEEALTQIAQSTVGNLFAFQNGLRPLAGTSLVDH